MTTSPTSDTSTGKPTSQTGTTPTEGASGLPEWMPGGSVDAEQEPVFNELVTELDLLG